MKSFPIKFTNPGIRESRPKKIPGFPKIGKIPDISRNREIPGISRKSGIPIEYNTQKFQISTYQNDLKNVLYRMGTIIYGTHSIEYILQIILVHKS